MRRFVVALLVLEACRTGVPPGTPRNQSQPPGVSSKDTAAPEEEEKDAPHEAREGPPPRPDGWDGPWPFERDCREYGYHHAICGPGAKTVGFTGSAYVIQQRPEEAIALFSFSAGDAPRPIHPSVEAFWDRGTLWARLVTCPQCRAVQGMTLVVIPGALSDNDLRCVQTALWLSPEPLLRTLDDWQQAEPQAPPRGAVPRYVSFDTCGRASKPTD